MICDHSLPNECYVAGQDFALAHFEVKYHGNNNLYSLRKSIFLWV